MRWFVILLVFLMSGCANTAGTYGSKSTTLERLLKKRDVIAVPYKRSNRGLFIIDVAIDDEVNPFLIDTGATRSAVFKGEVAAIVPDKETQLYANIFGLVNAGTHPIIELPEIRVGPIKKEKWLVALLPERDEENRADEDISPAGILGMDFVADFSLYADPETKILYFIPGKYSRPLLQNDWLQVYLKPNPYSESINELRFFDLRIGGHLIPAILDTGAEFNVLNWDASVIPEIRRLKRKLRQDWEIQGANDVFDPAIRISVESMRAGRMVWSENKFIVMNFDHLDLLGASDKPLVIAGADLLGDRGFYMNFQTNEMWLAPDENLDRTDSSGPVGEMKEPGLRVIPGG